MQLGRWSSPNPPPRLHRLDQRSRWAWGVVGHLFDVIIEDVHKKALSGLGDSLKGDVFFAGDADAVVGVRFAHADV